MGEAPSHEEVLFGRPFVGSAGRELDAQLRLAGIDRGACLVTNVFDVQAPGNDVSVWCVGKKEFLAEAADAPAADLPDTITHAPLQRGKYLRPEHWPRLQALRDELRRAAPHVVVPLGNTALWAVCGVTGISTRRGALMEGALLPGAKVLPTFHPAAILRGQYEMRPVAIADLMKARREGESAEWQHVHRELWLDPTLDDLARFEREHIRTDPPPLVAFDIETARGQIECIGFAPSSHLALVVPFVDWRRPDRSYWLTPGEERAAWDWVRGILEDASIKKLAQNGPYDVQWLRVRAGICVRGYCEDTRLLHHAIYPELPKDLAFLGSVYENEGAWKLLRKGPASKVLKRDE